MTVQAAGARGLRDPAAPNLPTAPDALALDRFLTARRRADPSGFEVKAAAAYLLQGRIGESFDASITGVAPKGTFVRIIAPRVEGRVVPGARLRRARRR